LPDGQLQPVRGGRDFFGEEKARRDRVVDLLKRVFNAYAFEPLETPAMERLEVLSSKFAGGEEILKETFKVKDQGGRDLGLRYDLTVPLCRFVAANPRMPFPFKRYAIAPVWRDGPLKAGRYREFYQCDADIVGSFGMIADAEILKLASAIFFELFPGNFIIKVSNRKILDGILEYSGVPEEKWLGCVLAIDKLPKIGRDGVERELEQAGIGKSGSRNIIELISLDGNSDKKLEKFEGILKSEVSQEGIAEMRTLLAYSKEFGCGEFLQFDPSLARGLNYYTSTIFEAFALGRKITSSIAAGGRYDDLIGKFAGSSERVPAVGISFGLDVVCEALKVTDPPGRIPPAGVYVCAIGKTEGSQEGRAALQAAEAFRKESVRTFLDLNSRSINKNIEAASKRGFRFLAVIGEKEARDGKILLRDLLSGKQSVLGIKDAIAQISS